MALTGWNTVHEGRAVHGLWSPQLRHAHTLPRTADIDSCLDALPSKLPHPSQDRQYDCGSIHQPAGWHSLSASTQIVKIFLWGRANLLPLHATHVSGVLNVGADFLSIGNPLYGYWRLHPQVLNQIWDRYGLDLFASHKETLPVVFVIAEYVTLELDALAHP